MCGLKGADFGRGRGPWTVQVSFRVEGLWVLGEVELVGEGESSR